MLLVNYVGIWVCGDVLHYLLVILVHQLFNNVLLAEFWPRRALSRWGPAVCAGHIIVHKSVCKHWCTLFPHSYGPVRRLERDQAWHDLNALWRESNSLFLLILTYIINVKKSMFVWYVFTPKLLNDSLWNLHTYFLKVYQTKKLILHQCNK